MASVVKRVHFIYIRLLNIVQIKIKYSDKFFEKRKRKETESGPEAQRLFL